MKKLSLILMTLTAGIQLTACMDNTGNNSGKKTETANLLTEPTNNPHLIPADTANKMINSYLHSIGTGDTNLHSLILDAATVRNYLNSDSGKNVTSLKVMFAHTLSYINQGGKDLPCGYRSGALTFILAGYKQNGNFVLAPGGTGIDYSSPCPSSCPTIGTAASDLLPE